ncbi:endonuclease VIII [Parabacteroides sp. AM08-6]|uniref:endonuclease VIII n=1 Tax=Parabacteroides sp. AM08-6 TaxID=2292053 RepID=UPI000EFE225C|nr:endonuclease VIII [Parabacteroides sp. AM08-6]RHJ83918.1 endonuclease VIII [Parabacteroides sp. AM08-6]
MIEAPEALYIAEQMNQTIQGKRITFVTAGYTPHKFAWFYGNPENYGNMLTGKIFGITHAYGGLLETDIEDSRLLLGDGVNLRYFKPGDKIPDKHQLLIGFEDESFLTGSVRMYGGILCFPADSFECSFTPYRDSAKNKPQVMSDAFNLDYFLTLINSDEKQKKTAKAFLATEQTIPGLGNGVLQDILFNARLHPKTRINTLTDNQKENLFHCVKSTLKEIYQAGGRNSETDLFGKKGNYFPILSKDTCGKPCPVCGEAIRKENYMGGSIYYCFECQK